jgi:hypothetical protein
MNSEKDRCAICGSTEIYKYDGQGRPLCAPCAYGGRYDPSFEDTTPCKKIRGHKDKFTPKKSVLHKHRRNKVKRKHK